MTVNVYGPADVTEIDPRQVIRAFPKADVAQRRGRRPRAHRVRPARPAVAVHPGRARWQRSAGPLDHPGRGRGASRHVRRTPRRRPPGLDPPRPAPAARRRLGLGARTGDGRQGRRPGRLPTLEQRLSEGNAAHNLSRLVCPRRLDDYTAYVACVVPTFEVGRQAGLGLSTGDSLAPAWGTAPDDFDSGDPASMVELPVYYSWSFATGEEGNFESLAHKLQAAGSRRPASDGAGSTRRTRGSVSRRPSSTRTTRARRWSSRVRSCRRRSPRTRRRGGVADRARAALGPAGHRRSGRQAQPAADVPGARATTTAPPLVGPPLYGGHHAPAADRDPSRPRASPPGSASSTSTPATASSAGSAPGSSRPSRKT